MNIEEFLKTENARISCGNNWLYWSDIYLDWWVVTREPYKRSNKTLYQDDDLSEALKALKGEG
jgi:hypothetical protein